MTGSVATNLESCRGASTQRHAPSHPLSLHLHLAESTHPNECLLFSLSVQVSMGSSVSDKKSYVISGHWDPCDPVFAVLNQETPKDRRVFMTVAIDLVIRK